jgi:hypothetical protein
LFRAIINNSNLFCKNRCLLELETNINIELSNIDTWLCANKLSLNVEKSNFLIFHPYQKNILTDIKFSVRNKDLKQVDHLKYLGVFSILI